MTEGGSIWEAAEMVQVLRSRPELKVLISDGETMDVLKLIVEEGSVDYNEVEKKSGLSTKKAMDIISKLQRSELVGKVADTVYVTSIGRSAYTFMGEKLGFDISIAKNPGPAPDATDLRTSRLLRRYSLSGDSTALFLYLLEKTEGKESVVVESAVRRDLKWTLGRYRAARDDLFCKDVLKRYSKDNGETYRYVFKETK